MICSSKNACFRSNNFCVGIRFYEPAQKKSISSINFYIKVNHIPLCRYTKTIRAPRYVNIRATSFTTHFNRQDIGNQQPQHNQASEYHLHHNFRFISNCYFICYRSQMPDRYPGCKNGATRGFHHSRQWQYHIKCCARAGKTRWNNGTDQ